MILPAKLPASLISKACSHWFDIVELTQSLTAQRLARLGSFGSLQVIVKNTLECKEIPPGIDWTCDFNFENPISSRWRIAVAVPKLRFQAAHSKDLTRTELKAVIQEARTVDAALLQWFDDVIAYDSLWAYQTRYTNGRTKNDPQYVWQGQYHVYSEFQVMMELNQYRKFRIFVNGVILTCLNAASSLGLLTGDHRDWDQAKVDALVNLQSLVDDICCSVLTYMSWETQNENKFFVAMVIPIMTFCVQVTVIPKLRSEWCKNVIAEAKQRTVGTYAERLAQVCALEKNYIIV